MYPNELRQINIPQFTKVQKLLEDKFTFALQSIQNDRINLRGNVFWVNTFNNIIKKKKVSNVIVRGLLPKRHGRV